jgi:molybdenum cofactor biosynthesis protein B
MSQSVEQHKSGPAEAIGICVVTISDSRTLETDRGGSLVSELARQEHQILRREIIPDEPQAITDLLQECEQSPEIQAVLMTGGTGISNRDQTYETVSSLFTREIPGYGELFRYLSFAEIGSATILSRTTAGLINQLVVLTMPGSPAAVKLAMEKIILPELRHLVREATK